MPPSDARLTARDEAEKVIAALLAEHGWHKYGVPSQPPRWYPMCGCGESFRQMRYDQAFVAHRAHVASVLADLMAERQAEALNDTADAWQQGQWSDALSGTQRPSQVQARIATAQAVTDWLRSRAEAHERPPVDIPDPKDTRDE